MKHAFVLFDYDHDAKPVAAAIMKDGSITFRPIFLKAAALPLNEAFANLHLIQNEVTEYTQPTMVNDFKSCLDSFRPANSDFNPYDIGFYSHINCRGMALDQANHICTSMVQQLQKTEPKKWMRVLGLASIAYHFMQGRGVYNVIDEEYPKYVLDVVSGRSKTLGFNVQGADESFHITSALPQHDIMVCIDWVAADLRAAQLMCHDAILGQAFSVSDPYAFMGGDKIQRTECKRMLLSALYGMIFDSPAAEFYPTLFRWARSTAVQILRNGYSESILGRRFHIRKDGSEIMSVFNSSIQGSVAHAMQNALWLLHKELPEHLMVEMHDSVILSSNRDSLKRVLDTAIGIMSHPFSGVIQDNPTFPIRVSMGNRWRRWQKIREIR